MEEKREITLKDIEEDFEAFCSFERHDERVRWLIQRVNNLEEGIKQIEIMGHNDDCLMCAMKDTWARKLIEEA